MKVRIAPLLAVVLGATSLAVTAAAAPTEPAAAQATVVGVAAGDERFSTLVTLVKRAGLVRTLDGKGPFTVFAPTNAAFAKLKWAAPDTYAAVVSDRALLRKILTYHVVPQRIPSSAAVAVGRKGGAVSTVQGERIRLSLRRGKVVLNGASRVVVADVRASNGVVHAIDAVIVPPSMS